MKRIFSLAWVLMMAQTTMGQVPVIQTVNPKSAYAGDIITITGSGFDATAANNKVFFGNVAASVTSATPTQLQVQLPASASSQHVYVLNTASNRGDFISPGVSVRHDCAGLLNATSFAAGVNVATNMNRGYSTAAGDLDLDGKTDLVFGSYVGGFPPSLVHILHNASSGPGNVAFVQRDCTLAFNSLYGVDVVDLDMDGRLDVIAYSAGTNFMVYRNTTAAPGAISLAPGRLFSYASTSFWAMSFADLDHDGDTDIITGGHTSTGFNILPNNSVPGTLSFGAKVVVPVSSPGGANMTDIKVTDLDGDGKQDFVLPSYNTGAVCIVRNTSSPGTWSFDPGFYLTTNGTGQPMAIGVGDLNGDGKAEVFVPYRNLASTSVWENISSPGTLGTGSFGTRIDLNSGGSFSMAEDLNGDGRVEVICNTLAAFANQHQPGTMTSASFVNPVAGWSLYGGGLVRAIAMGDFDSDGYLDVASCQDAVPGNAHVRLRVPAPGFYRPVPQTYTAISSVCDDGTWAHVYPPSNPMDIMVSVRDNGLNIGTITADTYVEGVPYLTYSSQYLLRRHYVINPGLDPVGTKRVRLYYTQAEFDDLNLIDPSITAVTNLAVFKYDGPMEDGVLDLSSGTLTTIPAGAITHGTAFGGRYVEFDVTGFSEFWIGSANNPVPVEWVDFTALQTSPQAVALSWEVASVNGIQSFDIERSVNGSEYKAIGTLEITNNGQAGKTWHFVDEDAFGESNAPYYRIKSMEQDGSALFSDVRQVINLHGGITAKLYPNPGNDVLNLELNSVRSGEWRLDLVDMMGRNILTRNGNMDAGFSLVLPIEVAELPSGRYNVRITMPGMASKNLVWVRQ